MIFVPELVMHNIELICTCDHLNTKVHWPFVDSTGSVLAILVNTLRQIKGFSNNWGCFEIGSRYFNFSFTIVLNTNQYTYCEETTLWIYC